jgi:small GTP-binding protein
VVFDLSQPDTLQNVENWLKSLAEIQELTVPVLLVGNKCDLRPAVTPEQIQEVADRHQLGFFQTSALTGEGINEVFGTLLERMVAQSQEMAAEKESSGGANLEGKANKRGCC